MTNADNCSTRYTQFGTTTSQTAGIQPRIGYARQHRIWKAAANDAEDCLGEKGLKRSRGRAVSMVIPFINIFLSTVSILSKICHSVGIFLTYDPWQHGMEELLIQLHFSAVVY